MDRHRPRTTTLLVSLIVLAFFIVHRAPTSDALYAQASWRGLVVEPEQCCAPYDAGDYRYPQSVEDRIVAQLGGVYGSLHRTVVREPIRDGHRAYRRPLRGARQRPVRRGFSNQAAVRHRSTEPHAGRTARESIPEGRPRCGRVAPCTEPLLVRGPGDRGLTTIQAHHRPA